MFRFRLLPAVLLVLAWAPVAAAQVLQPPPRPVRGLFGGGRPPDPARLRQELTLTANFLGGYDDNLTPPGTAENPFQPRPSGYVGFGESTLRYFLGRDAHQFEVSGRGYVNTFRNLGITPSYGGDASVRAETNLGRRSQLRGWTSVRYEPFFSMGLFGPLQDVPDTARPDANPTNGITQSRSWATDASASIDRQWTRRTRTAVGYLFSNRTYVEGVGFNSVEHGANFALDHSISRSTSLRADYRYSHQVNTEQSGLTQPITDHDISVGGEYRRNLSRTRQISFSGRAGALYVDTLVLSTGARDTYWAPSGFGSARVDLGRSWSVAGDYRRSLTVLEGISPQVFISNAATLTVGGFTGDLVESVFTAGYANGLTSVAPAGGPRGEYDSYTATAQARIRLTRWWSALVIYNHFYYWMNDAAREPLGVSPEMHRNSIRVGFTWSLPLYGGYLEPARRTGRD